MFSVLCCMTDRLLAKNILATITYYDVLDFPMTAFELWRHMITADGKPSPKTWTLQEVSAVLETPDVQQFIVEKNGMYMLAGREDLVTTRRTRERVSMLKIKKLRRYVRVLRVAPFVRMIALTGRLSYKNGEKSSDLDILVVFKDGHIWTGRVLFTLLTQIMGVRRYGKYHADRVCLNQYISKKHLTVPTKDLYGAHEYSFIVPLYGAQVFQDFVAANTWIRKYKPHFMAQDIESLWTLGDTVITRYIRACGEVVFHFRTLENIARDVQSRKIMNNPKTSLPGACILANDKHLVFLPKPHGPRVLAEFKKRFAALEIPWRT